MAEAKLQELSDQLGYTVKLIDLSGRIDLDGTMRLEFKTECGNSCSISFLIPEELLADCPEDSPAEEFKAYLDKCHDRSARH